MEQGLIPNVRVAGKGLKDKDLHTLDKEQVKLYWTMYSALDMKVV